MCITSVLVVGNVWNRIVEFLNNLTGSSMSKKVAPGGQNKGTIAKSTKDGKLYVKPSDLFSQDSVQKLVDKVASSKALEGVNKLTTRIG
jgi:hypothetical protein